MKILNPPKRYRSIEAFYAEVPDVDRRYSPELDFGVLWTEPHERGWTFPRSRLTWVEKTGELIVVRGVRFIDLPEREWPVKVIAVIEGRDVIEEALRGWEHECRTEGLGWVYRRLAEFVGTEACS